VQWQCRELSLARFLLLYVLRCCWRCIPLPGLARLSVLLFSAYGEFSHCGDEKRLELFAFKWEFKKKLAKTLESFAKN
jgi:hypothetical protein